MLKKSGAVLGKFDRRVWLLLVAMLVFRFGQGLYFAGFFTLAEIFGCCFGAGYDLSPVVAGLLLDARLPEIIWTIQLIAAALAAASLLALAALRK